MRARTIAGLLVVIAIGIVCVGYAPTNLGGDTTYVSTYGTSMQPRFHAGDLAVVQPARAYRVGDVAAYRSPTLNEAVVLHRIVAVHDGHYTFKGDNNDFLDPSRPTADQIVGRLRFRVADGGAIRGFIARPYILYPLLALVIGGAASGFFVRKRRRTAGGYDRQPVRPAQPRWRGLGTPDGRRLRVVVPVAAAVAAAGFLIAAVAVFAAPRTERTTRRESYAQHLTLGYAANAAKGAAYPDGKVTTGEPVFTRLVERVDIALDYDLRADNTASGVRGTYQVIANVASSSGWSQSIPLTPSRPFTGTHFAARAPLHLDALRKLQTRFSAETGLQTGSAAVAIEPIVHTSGKIADTAFTSDVKSKLEFQLSPDTLMPASTDADAGTVTRAGSVTVAATRAADVAVWKLTVPAETARIALFVTFALALCAAAALLAIDRRRVALGEMDAISRRYGRLLIAVDTIPDAGGRAMVRVESMKALARLAHVNEQPIVHADGAAGHRFALATEAVVYFYDTAPEPDRPVTITPVPVPA